MTSREPPESGAPPASHASPTPRAVAAGRAALPTGPASSARTRWLVAISGLAGAILFVGAIGHVGREELLQGVSRLGAGFVVVLALGGLRFAVRALAWMACVGDAGRLGFWPAFEAVVASDALGTLTPAGPLASEPAKVVLASDRLPVDRGVPSVAIENILYTTSAGLVIAAGAVGLLPVTALQGSLRTASTVAAGGFAALVFALVFAAQTHRRPLRWMATRVGHLPGGRRLAGWLATLTDLEDRTLGFAAGRPWRWLGVFGLELVFHVLAVVEIWLTLGWVMAPGTQPTLIGAFVLESANRLITVLFKFVPLRVGVDEAGSGAVASVLSIDPAAGVALAVIRKGRTLSWTAVGVLLLLRRGWAGRR